MTFLFTTLLFGAVNATVFTVTKITDTNDGSCSADCSLREAVQAANASVNDDIIEFDPAVFATAQTIRLSSSALSVSNNGTLTINGTGINLLSISGGNTTRVFLFNTNSNVTLRRLTIKDGVGFGNGISGGGGISSFLAVSRLEEVVVTNCRTFVTDPVSSVNGGGILNRGTMTILNSRIEFNRNERPAGTKRGRRRHF